MSVSTFGPKVAVDVAAWHSLSNVSMALGAEASTTEQGVVDDHTLLPTIAVPEGCCVVCQYAFDHSEHLVKMGCTCAFFCHAACIVGRASRSCSICHGASGTNQCFLTVPPPLPSAARGGAAAPPLTASPLTASPLAAPPPPSSWPLTLSAVYGGKPIDLLRIALVGPCFCGYVYKAALREGGRILRRQGDLVAHCQYAEGSVRLTTPHGSNVLLSQGTLTFHDPADMAFACSILQHFPLSVHTERHRTADVGTLLAFLCEGNPVQLLCTGSEWWFATQNASKMICYAPGAGCADLVPQMVSGGVLDAARAKPGQYVPYPPSERDVAERARAAHYATLHQAAQDRRACRVARRKRLLEVRRTAALQMERASRTGARSGIVHLSSITASLCSDHGEGGSDPYSVVDAMTVTGEDGTPQEASTVPPPQEASTVPPPPQEASTVPPPPDDRTLPPGWREVCKIGKKPRVVFHGPGGIRTGTVTGAWRAHQMSSP